MGFNVTGIDISENAIKAANEFASETNRRITFALTNGKDLPFSDNSFDVVIIWNQTLGIIYSENSQIDFLKECNRVLKNNGIISFSGHDHEYIELNHPHCLADIKFYPFKDENIYWETFTIDEMKILARESKFNVLSCQRGKLRNDEDGVILHCVCRK
jgi:ubiquinone/menaquinone biosynthesis C-methylase UbiE